MARRHHRRVIHQGNFLLRVVLKAEQCGLCPQTKVPRKPLQRGLCAAAAVVVGRLDHHNRIRVKRCKHKAQSLDLLGAAHIVTPRPPLILQKRPLIIKQLVKPLDIIGRDPHQPRKSLISAQARLIATIRFSAILIASSGSPRATSLSGWLSCTSRFQAARSSSMPAAGVSPKTE